MARAGSAMLREIAESHDPAAEKAQYGYILEVRGLPRSTTPRDADL